MKFNKFWKRTTEIENNQDSKGTTLEDLLLQAGLTDGEMTEEMALNIPTVQACTELISGTVAMLPIKLYKDDSGKIVEVADDIRINLLNDDTRDTLTGFEFKKALVNDFLIHGKSYSYINKVNGKVKSLHYVKKTDVSINNAIDPIFKDYQILVNGETYRPFNFIKMLKNTKNGSDGRGIIQSNHKILHVAYNSLTYENVLAKTGGNKKGFIKAASKLTKEAIDLLKEQWRKMYSNNTENCIVLNNGLEFQESSSTSMEMQLNENKRTNAVEICKIFNVPPAIIEGDGKAKEDEYNKFVKMAILPILENLISSLNRDLLLEKEKESFYFAVDTKELLKGDVEKRYKAYEIGVKNGFMSINEVRYEENRTPIEAFENTIKLGLQDVLFNTKTNTIYTPNTDKTTKMNENLKGGE